MKSGIHIKIDGEYYTATRIEMIDKRDGKYHIIFDDASKPKLTSKTEVWCDYFKIDTRPLELRIKNES